MDDGTAAELTQEEEPMNVKKDSGWFPALAVGIVISVVQLYVAKQGDRNDTLVAVATKVEYLTAAVKQLTEQPYVRRDEFQSGIAGVENRVTGLEKRVDQWEQRASSDGRKR